MNVQMQKKALAARDAHMALLRLKKLVEDAAETTVSHSGSPPIDHGQVGSV